MKALGVVLHLTASEWGDVAAVDQWHRQRGFSEIGYHWLILNGRRKSTGGYNSSFDGVVEEGRNATKTGAHCKAGSMNNWTLGISCVGTPGKIPVGAAPADPSFTRKKYLTAAQAAALIDTLAQLCIKYGWDPMGQFRHPTRRVNIDVISQHSDHDPGKPDCASLSVPAIRMAVAERMQVLQAQSSLPRGRALATGPDINEPETAEFLESSDDSIYENPESDLPSPGTCTKRGATEQPAEQPQSAIGIEGHGLFNPRGNAFVEQISLRNARQPRGRMMRDLGGIPTSDEITGIELRIKKIFIKENGTARLWPFSRYADLYVILTSIDDLGGEPNVVRLEGFADVDDNEVLPVERTAYYWKQTSTTQQPPSQVHAIISIIKSNEGIRDFGKALSNLRKSEDYKSVVGSLVKTVASGGTDLIIDGLMSITGLVGGILGEVEDSPLLTQVLSFTDINGDWDTLGSHPFTRGNGNVDLDLALIVRDTHRENAVSRDGMNISIPMAQFMALMNHTPVAMPAGNGNSGVRSGNN